MEEMCSVPGLVLEEKTGKKRRQKNKMNKKPPHNNVYWLLSLFLSLAAIAAIGYKWKITQPQYKKDCIPVSNREELEKFLKTRTTIEFKNGKKPVSIPTGFFIQSFSFINANDININGYIWMRFPKTLPKDFVKEFIFPEEVASSTTKMEKIYTEDQGDHEVIGWYFDVIVRQSFDYTDYPLDFQAVWLRIWSKDFIKDEEIIIVPDFDAYAPEALAANKFGMDVDIVPSGWQILETFFSYKTIPYDTSFGLTAASPYDEYSDFYFNLGVRRNFVDAFIVNLVPLFFVVLLLFALVMTVSGNKKCKESFGFNALTTIGICASLWFVVILLHIQVRQQFPGSKLLYIEYFYLIVYLVNILTALNSYLFSLDRPGKINIIHFKDNFIPKVSYWPLVLWMMAAVTWIKL
jgi:hypothetical protein